jgi:hypothetical protein
MHRRTPSRFAHRAANRAPDLTAASGLGRVGKQSRKKPLESNRDVLWIESIGEHDGLKSKAVDERVEKTHRSLVGGIFELVAHPFRNRQPLGAGECDSTHVPLPDPPRGLQLREDAPAPTQLDSLTSHGRSFTMTSTDGGELTATFDQLCGTPTSTVEYLQWSRDFPRWSITDIPPISAADPEAQQRFINLVDVLVDADIPVTFSAHVDLDNFLADASQRPDAFRMASRLRLLQSVTVPKPGTET